MRRILWLWLLPAALFLILPAAASAQGALSAALTGHRALRRGDQGPAVATLQTLLRSRGFDPTKIDGIYGPLTEKAVREAQQAYGLTEDGVAGTRTALALETGEAPSAVAVAPAPAVKTVTTLDQVVTEGPAQPTSTLVIHQMSTAQADATLDVAPEAAAPAHAQFALTFNGTPDAGLLPGILKTLKQYGMRATFFMTGQAAQEHPDLVAQIVAAGHEVADGGLSGTSMAALSPGDAKAQMQKAQAAIAKAAGRAPVYFRPPQGALSQPLADAATGLGLQTVLWTNVGVADDPAADRADLAHRLLEAVYPGSIVMLHQDRPGTAALLDGFLKGLADRGTRSVTLSELSHA